MSLFGKETEQGMFTRGDKHSNVPNISVPTVSRINVSLAHPQPVGVVMVEKANMVDIKPFNIRSWSWTTHLVVWGGLILLIYAVS